MGKKKRKSRKSKKTIPKILELIENLKYKHGHYMIKAGFKFKSKKDYNRKRDKIHLKKENFDG